MTAKPCRHCGEPIRGFPSRIRDRTFCSVRCYLAWGRAGLIDKPCEHCGKTMRVRESIMGRYRFCSRRCRTRWIAEETPKRFWSLVDKTSHAGGCWKYTGRINHQRGGYGSFDDRRRTVRAHVYAWVVTNGPIKRGLEVCHRCDNPACVRPDHLFLGTRQQNAADCKQKGRTSRGERHGAARLTDEVVREIRKLYAAHRPTSRGMYVKEPSRFSQKALARRFGVSAMSVNLVVRRKIWVHI